MTLKVKKFGKILVTRQDAKNVLMAIHRQKTVPTLDFKGVDVANHPFADELGKGLADRFCLADLCEVRLTGTNPYVQNCLEAGFSTATTH
jgi:hypothetical protein